MKESSNWPKCPKCKSRNIIINEIWNGGAITWEPEYTYDDGVISEGYPDHVEGECRDCKHAWKFRLIIQVDPDWLDVSDDGILV